MSNHASEAIPPPLDVQRAFGATGAAERFESGEGKTFGIGGIVMKPVRDATEAEWIGGVLEQVVEDGFRIARPIRASNGSWVFEGWTAWQRVEGASTKDRWHEVIRAGEKFHDALLGVSRPSFLDEREHQWATADRVAFGEAEIDIPAPINKQVAQLQAHLGRLDVPGQVIHGDLSENVLLADGLNPAIIDFSPYFRPTGFASSVVVVDAIVWHDAPFSLIGLIQPAEVRYELLARALIYRLIAAAIPRRGDLDRLTGQADAHRALVDHVLKERAGQH